MFYEAFFKTVEEWVEPSSALVEDALRLATEVGLAALDALHVTAALKAGADEFVTTEKPTKPIHRVTAITVRSLA